MSCAWAAKAYATVSAAVAAWAIWRIPVMACLLFDAIAGGADLAIHLYPPLAAPVERDSMRMSTVSPLYLLG
jgi:hypothetical protein